MSLQLYISFKNQQFREGFQQTAQVHYYWIVSDKRKPMVLQQIRTRGKMSEQDVTFVPGIFDDNVEQTLHPNLPKGWLNTPVARLLAAHMKGIRLFVNEVSSDPNPNQHVYICMEDDVVLHKNFEQIVQETANYATNCSEPSHIGIGYILPPTTIEKTTPLINEFKLHSLNKSTDHPGGAQCIMMNYKYAKDTLAMFENAYSKTDTHNMHNDAADTFLFKLPNSNHFLIEPPAALEDNPTFGTLLGHDWNADFYKTMIKNYNRDNYFKYAI